MSTETPVEPPPGHIRELELACVQFVQRALGLSLDYQPDTLPLLDHYLHGVPGQTDEIRALVAPAAGAYFGELVRRTYPARWFAPVGDYPVWRIEFEPCFLYFNPVAFAHEAILRQEIVEGGSGFGVDGEDLDTLRSALESLGQTDEEDYFKLSTRFEVLATVFDRLVARQAAPDEPALRLGPEVYRAALDIESEPGA